VPKIKDLVNTPTQKYENMYNIIKQNSSHNASDESSDDYTLIDLLPKPEEPTMKTELKNFLKKQMNKVNTGTDITALDSMSSSNSYSVY
jgi:hypothetical protein